MIKIKEAVIVEGKYDKIKLENILDTLIIQTNGFSIFRDKEKLKFIKKLADERGILILTDSDHAGFQIRSYISGSIDKSKIKHAYIPDVFGKEKRKAKFSKEGKIGVEGIDTKIILDALNKVNVLTEEVQKEKILITNADLYNDGLSGKTNSKELRKRMLKALDLPEFLSKNAFLNVLNSALTYEQYKKIVNNLN